VAIPPKTVDEAIIFILNAEEMHADLIEIRLDNLQNHNNIAKIQKCTNIPLIATNKPTKFGGNYTGTETKRQNILLDAAKNGFKYIDVDLGTPNQTELITKLKALSAKVIVSFHDFQTTPTLAELNKVLEKQVVAGADVCKIVTTANTLKDNLTVLDFVADASKKADLVCFAMGEHGKPSRLLSPVFGAFFTFASLDEKRKTAKGQLTIKEMKTAYEALRYEQNDCFGKN
jgi:3-dehydroquinate dehydratase type I